MSAPRHLSPTAAVLTQANADAEARARRDADEGAALRRALDAEQRERAALAEHAAAYNQAERARADTEEESRRLKGEVERLGRKLAEAEEGLEVQTVQARKAREEAGTLRAENSALSHQVPSPFISSLPSLSSPRQHFPSSPSQPIIKVATLEGGMLGEAEVAATLQKQLRHDQEELDRQQRALAAKDAQIGDLQVRATTRSLSRPLSRPLCRPLSSLYLAPIYLQVRATRTMMHGPFSMACVWILQAGLYLGPALPEPLSRLL